MRKLYRPIVSSFPIKRAVQVCAGVLVVILLATRWTSSTECPPSIPSPHPAVRPQQPALKAPFLPPSSDRHLDLEDAFASYSHRSTCQISSQSLHAPFSPLCGTRQELLRAMSGGGRIGFDSPFMPRGCDMRWFSTEEICEILSRFHAVVLVGDSLMRHVMGSMSVLIRKDLGYGAVTNWNFRDDELRDCWCETQINVKTCSLQGIYKTDDIARNDPQSLACSADSINLMIEVMTESPPSPTRKEIDEIIKFSKLPPANSRTLPTKPIAMIYGIGLWNHLSLRKLVHFLDNLEGNLTEYAPYLRPNVKSDSIKQQDSELPAAIRLSHHKDRVSTEAVEFRGPITPETKRKKYRRSNGSVLWHRLFVTPSASGRLKPDEFILSQGSKPLAIYEESCQELLPGGYPGIEVLGTWNMSVQATTYDGVHLGLKPNLVKAMMIFNWLNMLPRDS